MNLCDTFIIWSICPINNNLILQPNQQFISELSGMLTKSLSDNNKININDIQCQLNSCNYPTDNYQLYNLNTINTTQTNQIISSLKTYINTALQTQYSTISKYLNSNHSITTLQNKLNSIINNYITVTNLNNLLKTTYILNNKTVFINSTGYYSISDQLLIHYFLHNLLIQLGQQLKNSQIFKSITATKRPCLNDQNMNLYDTVRQQILQNYVQVSLGSISVSQGINNIMNALATISLYEIDNDNSTVILFPNNTKTVIVKTTYRSCIPNTTVILNISLINNTPTSYLSMSHNKGSLLLQNNIKMSDTSLEAIDQY